MGVSVTWTCDFQGCTMIHTASASPDFMVREYDEGGEVRYEMPLEVVSPLKWCSYDPERHPEGQVLCPQHEREVWERHAARLRGTVES